MNNNKVQNLINNKNNIIQKPKQLSIFQLKALKMQLAKFNLNNKLLLTINKRINNYPHNKINNKMGSSMNQNIIYNFSKNNTFNNNNYFINNSNLNSASINNSARIGINNFVLKIITSIFNSLSCIIAKPQFINKHNKLIIRIPYYQNNIQKDSLFTNTNSNYIFNSLTNNLSNNNILNNNINSTNITKNIWIKWLKDYLHLNINKLNNNIIDINTINNYIKNDKIIDNKPSNNNFTDNINTKLLMNIANTNNFDYLNSKRLTNLKITSNKLLMLKIIKNLNYHNEISTDILGKGSMLHPVTKNTLDKIFGGVYDSKGYLGDYNFISDYKLISNKLLATNITNNNLDIKNIYSKEINTINKLSNNKLMVNLKLINKINQKLINLKSQFSNNNNESINFILNNIIKQFNPNILFYSTFANNQNNNIIKLLILNRQLSLINKLGVNLTNINKIDNAKLMLNIKIIKLIVKNNIILADKSKNMLTTVNTNNTLNNNILINKMKEAFLSLELYNNKAQNINNNNILKNNIIKFKWLGILLSKLFNKNISIELVRLWNVGLDPTILSKIISNNSMIDKSSVIFKKLWRKIVINRANKLISDRQNGLLKGNNNVYENIKLLDENKQNLKFIQVNDFINNLNTYNNNPITLAKTVGLSIKIGGRLSKERIQPKRTVKSLNIGALKKNGAIDSYKFTSKNKRGAFTVSVRLSSERCYSTSVRNSTYTRE
jgi:Mitochondrial ribosomal protein (VAR1)